MTFVELYGLELDRELGSADRTQLFTTLRRKAAINAAQLEWNKRTECYTRQTTVALVDETQEYDLEATVGGIADFGWISKQGVSVKIVDSSANVRYIEGDDLDVTTVARLNAESPNWRAASAGTPRKVYIRRDGGTVNLGLYPAPSITSGDTWTAIIPYVAIPADMSADVDEPFTVSSNPIKSLRMWHRALVYFAAADLEQFRIDAHGKFATHLQRWELEIVTFIGKEKPKGGQSVRLARNYRSRLSVARLADPRT